MLRSVLEAASDRAVPTTLTKTTVTELCHALEDQVLHEDLGGVLVAGFQRAAHWDVERDRYARLCEDPRRQALVFAAGAPAEHAPSGVTYLDVGSGHPLAREWFVLALTDRFSAMLFGRELATPADVADHERAFMTVWSFDPIVVSDLVALLEGSVGDLGAEVGGMLADAVERFPPRRPATGSMPRFGNAVFERLEARGSQPGRVAAEPADGAPGPGPRTEEPDPSARTGPTELVEVDLVAWLAEEVAALEGRGYEVTATVAGELDERHRVDPERLAEALAETVRTAHAAPERQRPVEIQVRCQPTRGHVVVEHDGAPPAEDQLAAARRHLEEQEGSLSVEVTDDRTVRFVLSVGAAPASDEDGRAHRRRSRPSRSAHGEHGDRGPGRTALVVDDEAALRGLLEALLRRAGWEVRTATTLAAAERDLAVTGADLLLLDVGLCEDGIESGLAALERVRPGIARRAVLLSAQPPVSGTLEGRPVAAKPFVWAELERAIERIDDAGEPSAL